MDESLTTWSLAVLPAVARVAAVLVIALVLNQLLRLVTQRLVTQAGTQTRAALMREQQTRTLAGLLYSAGTAVIFIVVILMLLPEFGVNITPIAAAAGLASLAVGFGAQHLVRDLINGFFIVFEDQYVVGDTVRVGADVVGRVEHMTLRRTVLRDAQGALVTVPNGEVRQVANLSRDWSQLHIDVAFPTDAAIDAALSVLERVCTALREEQGWSAALVDGPRVLGVEAVGSGGATVRLQIRSLPGRQHDVARELRRRIQAALENEKIPLRSLQAVELLNRTEPKRS
ncbi:MAG TPA: mechanosensitive ion channel family protein [Candidatus Acidoferrales bacterium]